MNSWHPHRAHDTNFQTPEKAIVTFSETRLPKHPWPGARCPPFSRSTLLLSMTASKLSMQSTADKIIALQYGNITSTASTPKLPSRGGRGCYGLASTITLNNSAASVASKMLASRTLTKPASTRRRKSRQDDSAPDIRCCRHRESRRAIF